jgi:mannose/cellobiose epimerase-like protein (N-acyl-D-glucosamine 2-epimerase family)
MSISHDAALSRAILLPTMDAILALSRFAREVLLPLSRDCFVDSVHGGFHERLDETRTPIAIGRKRLMVQSRQLYLLSHAALLGDRSGEQAMEHGYNFLLRNYRDLLHGGWYFAVTPSGEALDRSKDLYGHAFLLFALAWLHRAFSVPDAMAHAAETMDVLHARMGLPGGGFHSAASQDWTPSSDMRQQNPHMHLLEAVLALHDASGDPRWLAEADALVQLFQERLYHRRTGTLREFFAVDWKLHPKHGEIVEPGHQFEWAWLLLQYRQRGGRLSVVEEADSMFRFALRYGFDLQHGGLHDQIAPDGTPMLCTRRIWPMAEAIKACVAMTERGRDHRSEADRLAGRLLHDFVSANQIGWYETLTREGSPSTTQLPGSTPYHLFLAAAEAERLLPTQ